MQAVARPDCQSGAVGSHPSCRSQEQSYGKHQKLESLSLPSWKSHPKQETFPVFPVGERQCLSVVVCVIIAALFGIFWPFLCKPPWKCLWMGRAESCKINTMCELVLQACLMRTAFSSLLPCGAVSLHTSGSSSWLHNVFCNEEHRSATFLQAGFRFVPGRRSQQICRSLPPSG